MVVKLLIMPPAALLHSPAFWLSVLRMLIALFIIRLSSMSNLGEYKSNNLTAADNGIVAAVYIS